MGITQKVSTKGGFVIKIIILNEDVRGKSVPIEYLVPIIDVEDFDFDEILRIDAQIG